MEELEVKLRNLTFIVILGFVITLMLIIGLYFKTGTSTASTNKTNNNSSSTSDYDVSKMNEVDIDGALALFDEKGTHVLYMGRSTCSVCVQFVPVLNEVQEDLDFTTNYLDVATFMNDWKSAKEDLEPLTNKMDIEATANGEKGTLGELFVNYGYTPALVIIKDGKVVEGFFGYRDAESLTEILNEYL